ncbi:MAG TPA: alpha/beta hydrolase-fold protein [Rhizomicrobium sp.]|nr:alpha/beta hydrolase-fold protein [Rhizomicrobium sp.]
MKCANVVCAIIVAVGLLSCIDVTQAQTQPTKVQPGGGSPYVLLGTEVWDVPDPVSKRGYQVFVGLPASYEKEPNRRYPVLFVTDAGYGFPVIREISRRLNFERPQVEEFILVGLSYAKGEDGMQSRRRDYTPTPNGPRGAPAGTVHGRGLAYQAYLRDRVMPFIAQRYRTDPRRALFLGHSYGGLLGAQILFTDPGMFSGYILGSPSFWYDKRHIFSMEALYAARHRDLPAKVYMYVGAYESPRFNRINEMVGDNREFEGRLKKRKYPNLVLKSEVLNDEDHVSVAPRGFTHGLKYLLPAR